MTTTNRFTWTYISNTNIFTDRFTDTNINRTNRFTCTSAKIRLTELVLILLFGRTFLQTKLALTDLFGGKLLTSMNIYDITATSWFTLTNLTSTDLL